MTRIEYCKIEFEATASIAPIDCPVQSLFVMFVYSWHFLALAKLDQP